MSKKGFLLGLALGGAAIVTVAMKMDDDKKAELKAKAQRGLAEFKDRAIDYAFYANDAAEDFKSVAGQQFEDAKSKVADMADQYQTAKQSDGPDYGSSLDQATDSLRSELARVEAEAEPADDDIVIDSAAAFGEDVPESADSAATTPDSAASDTDSDATSATDDDQPTK